MALPTEGTCAADAARAALAHGLVQSVAQAILSWSRHSLTVFGRCYIAKQCLQSKAVHAASFTPLPEATIKRLESLIYGYIARNRLVAAAEQAPLYPVASHNKWHLIIQ